jgi:hypothetical protein
MNDGGTAFMNIDVAAHNFKIKVGLLLIALTIYYGEAAQCPDSSYSKYFLPDHVGACDMLICSEIDSISFAKADTLKSNKKIEGKDSVKIIYSVWKINLKGISIIRGVGDLGKVILYKAKALNSNKPILPYLHKKQVYCLMRTPQADTLVLWYGYNPQLFKRGIFQRNSYIDSARNASMNSKIEEVLHKITYDSAHVDVEKKQQELRHIKDSLIQQRNAQ